MTADLALAADPGFLERSADPAEFVIQACERAKVWLREALEHGDIDQIVEVKSQAEAVRVYTMQKQLGKDAQLSAAEIVRRAERGIHVAVEVARKRGDVLQRGQTLRRPGHRVNGDDSVKSLAETGVNKSEFHNTGDLAEPSSEQFEEALGDARAEGDLSRANVVRKIKARTLRKSRADEWIPEPGDNHGDSPVQRRKLIRAWAEQGYSSRQMEEMLGTNGDTIRRIAREMGIEITADAVIGKTRVHDSNRIVRETVHALEGLAMGVQLVEPDDLDLDQVQDWAASLTQSVRVLSRLIKTLKETAQ